MVSPELLRRYPFFGRLTLAELAALAQGASRVEAAPGECVIREGEPARNCYLIVEGEVGIVMAPELLGPQAGVLTSLGPGELFGWSALVRHDGYTASARTLTRAVLVRFSGDELLARCETDHDFGYRLMREIGLVIASRLHDTRLQLAGLIQA
jgi:CRP-like cAMP-binding protein